MTKPDRWTQFERLAKRAQHEPGPSVDLRARVLATLVDYSESARGRREWVWAASVSAALASLALLWSVVSLDLLANPYVVHFQPLLVALP